jgi:hypothetical protein
MLGVMHRARNWRLVLLLQVTYYLSIMDKYTTEVIPVDSRVVVDKNVVTNQCPVAAIEFGLALVGKLYGKEKEDVAGPLVSYITSHERAWGSKWLTVCLKGYYSQGS